MYAPQQPSLRRSETMWTSTERSVTKRSLTNESSPCAASTSLLPSEHPAGALGQIEEDAELGGRQLDRLIADQDLVPARVDGELLDVDSRFVVGGLVAAAQHGPDARGEHPRAERLGHVVGGTELEPDHHVRFAALGREHDDGDAPRLGVGLEPAADLEPVDAGQHEVEHDEVRQPRARRGQRVFPAGDHRHAVAFLVQVVLDELEDVALVVDDEHVLFGHRRSFGVRLARATRCSPFPVERDVEYPADVRTS